MMHAILIDPYERTVSEVTVDGSLVSMHEAVGADIVGSISLTRTDICWVNDEGYLRAGIPVFKLENYPHPCAGKGLILGINDRGENLSTKLTLVDVQSRVSFPDLETTGMMENSHVEKNVVRNGIKFDTAIIGGGPILRQRRNG